MTKDLRFESTNEIARNEAANAYTRERVEHWDGVARKTDTWSSWGQYYHRRLTEIYQFLVAPNQRVLEIGCGLGDLLASLKPSVGIGVDFSNEMIKCAKERHPGLQFVQCDAHNLSLKETFDIIILSDIANDLWDVQTVFEQTRSLVTSQTRILLNFYSHLWEVPFTLAQRFGCATPVLPQNWLTVEDISNLLYLADFEVIRHWQEILWPLSTPLLALLSNRYLVKIWPFRILAMTNFVIARPRPARTERGEEPLVSVIVPARNEAGNVSRLLARMPNMGRRTELIFVEGHSEDDTYAAIEKAIVEHPELLCKLYRQTGNGKGDAVRLGFSRSSGEILMILDADMTVPPEDLPSIL